MAVGYLESLQLGFKKYRVFSGRSIRAEYWWWALFGLLGDVVLSVFDMLIGTYNWQNHNGLLSGLFGFGILIPSLAVGTRRLHDIGKSGWWQLMWLGVFLVIPAIVLIVWNIRQGDDGSNRYGPDPRKFIDGVSAPI